MTVATVPLPDAAQIAAAITRRNTLVEEAIPLAN